MRLRVDGSGEQTDLGRFLDAHEVSACLTRYRYRLATFDARRKTGKQGAGGEGDIGKPRRSDRSPSQGIAGLREQQMLHQALARTHEIGRVGSLVGGYGEIAGRCA